MSVLGRALTFFPAMVIAMALACFVAAIVTRSPLWLAGVAFCLYALPLLAFRMLNVFRPLREQRSYLDGGRYSAWWGSHQLQRLYIGIPQLESFLQLTPGAFSLWLRLWGSRIGRRVHWTPRVEIADRSMLAVGDDVVFGHKVECYAHAIKPSSRGRLILLVRRITIGNGVFLGAGVRIGPGVRIDDATFVPTLTDLYVGVRIEESVPA